MSETALDPIIPKSLMECVKDTIGIQASTKVEVKKVGAVKPERFPGIDLIAVIGIKSSKLMGHMGLCFPKATFLGIVGKMLGEKFTEIDKIADAGSELLNILYGSARVKINQGGHDFLPAIPTVVHGSNIHVAHGEVPLIVKLDCECEYGPFHVEISLKRAT